MQNEGGQNGAVCFEQKDEAEKGDKCGSAKSAGAVEINVIPMRAEAADCGTKTRHSLTARPVTALSYSGILFVTIV